MDYNSLSIELHGKLCGKLSVTSKIKVDSKEILSQVYTPGVGAVSRKIAENPSDVYKYTMKKNCVAVVSDGSAVLGLGNIGALAAIAVMEGKAVLFKELAGIDAFPICLDEQDPDKLIEIIKALHPVFGGINLEDIAAPKCFQIEAALQDLGIPVMHDDQHGTAVVVSAALTNACRVTKKNISQLKVVINGAGAAGTAIARMLACQDLDEQICTPVGQVILCDTKGAIYRGRKDLAGYKLDLAERTNPDSIKGELKDVILGADVFIGVSKAGLVSKEMIKSMNKDPIVFAMANPVPEIMPQDALDAGAAVVGTGRSDFQNQVNNSLGFPGIFRGALDSGAKRINGAMKLAASQAIAKSVKNPTRENILPSTLDKSVAQAVAAAVAKAARESGACE
ncbi:NADP-dependent malic enzyme [Candidatus Micrarchaeota archaeon]|nr:NADP-dependent malic enzyme [Candidatus Micrarchaeota archaeon]